MSRFIVTFIGLDESENIRNVKNVIMERENIVEVFRETKDVIFEFDDDGLDYEVNEVMDIEFLTRV